MFELIGSKCAMLERQLLQLKSFFIGWILFAILNHLGINRSTVRSTLNSTLPTVRHSGDAYRKGLDAKLRTCSPSEYSILPFRHFIVDILRTEHGKSLISNLLVRLGFSRRVQMNAYLCLHSISTNKMDIARGYTTIHTAVI